MKWTLTTLCALAAGALVLVAGAGANGSAYSPGLAYGWPGVASSDDVHYVTLGPSKWTVVAALRSNGHVVRTGTLRGFYAVPLVAYDGTTGGLSGDGESLALGSYGPRPGEPGKTRFVVVNTRSLTVRRTFVLGGAWSFDAISPNGSTLYLTEHLRAGDDPLYRVRPLDARTGRLQAPIVDRLEDEEEMGGVPFARAASADGRWAYTLYARRGAHPFVHALDTAKREAFCIDLPLRLGYNQQTALRLKLGAAHTLSVRLYNGRQLATVDTGTWKVERS